MKDRMGYQDTEIRRSNVKTSSLFKACWKEEIGNGQDPYSKKREGYYNRNRWGLESIKDIRAEERNIKAEIIEKEKYKNNGREI